MKIALGSTLMIGCTVIANLLMKVGAAPKDADRLVFGIVGWQVIAGLAALGMAGVLYAGLLRLLLLTIAQSFAAAQFIAVILAAVVVLAEPIPPARWIGIGLFASSNREAMP
jgi:drug/metabolite transporter (DMT)-like permease